MKEVDSLIQQTLSWDGRERDYFLYLPPNLKPNQKYPAVVVLHGATANAQYAARMANFFEMARRDEAILVFPNGTGLYRHAVLTWNAKHCCGYAKEHNIDDLGFLSQMVEELIGNHSVDETRIYMTGISNGAMMAHWFACHHSEKVRAIAPVAGNLNLFEQSPTKPIPVMAFHGTADKHSPYDGGSGSATKYPREDKPVKEGIQFWVQHNQCNTIPQTETFEDVVQEIYSGGQSGSEVILYTIQDGGHSWPGGREGIRFGNMDPPTQSISASQLIWDFFQKHS